jgi:hypothetical protein
VEALADPHTRKEIKYMYTYMLDNEPVELYDLSVKENSGENYISIQVSAPDIKAYLLTDTISSTLCATPSGYYHMNRPSFLRRITKIAKALNLKVYISDGAANLLSNFFTESDSPGKEK